MVITIDYTYDLNDPGDRDRFERELMRGNDYLEYTKKIRWNGRLQSVKNGNFIGQTAPYGYEKVELKEGKETYHTLRPIPENAEVLQMIFRMYRDGMGTTKISDRLNELHIPAPKGPKWTPNCLPKMLENVHYLGKVSWNRRATVRKVEDGEIKIGRPVAEEFLIFEGKHPAIIDQELWDAVQSIRGKHPRNKNAYNLTNPLAGLLWCECGKALVGRKYNDKNGRERCAPRFTCREQKFCGNASATMKEVFDEITKALRSAIADFEVRIENKADDSVRVHQQYIARLEKKLEELEALEVKQWDEKTKGGMPEHVFKKLNSQTVAEIEDVRHALYEAQEEVPEPINLQEKIITFQAALDALEDPDAPVKEKNQLLRACIERITYSRKKYTAVGTPKDMQPTPIHLDVELRV